MMNQRLLKQSRQRGVSMLEMGMVVAMLGVLVVGVFMAYKKIQMDRYLQTAIEQIPKTITAISGSAITQSTTAGTTTQVMSMMGAWPSERVVDAGQATVKVNGAFPSSTEQVFGYTGVFAPRVRVANSGFSYWINGVPEAACLALLQVLVTHRNVANITVGSMDAAKVPANGNTAGTGASLVTVAASGAISVNMAAATTACSLTPGSNKQIQVLIAREG